MCFSGQLKETESALNCSATADQDKTKLPLYYDLFLGQGYASIIEYNLSIESGKYKLSLTY